MVEHASISGNDKTVQTHSRLVVHRPEVPVALLEGLACPAGTVRVGSHGDHCHLEIPGTVGRDTITRLREAAACDINLLPPGFDAGRCRLLVTDMDSTLIAIECIDEIADFLGVKAEVAAITEAAMRGEIDFAVSLRRRVGLLTGLEAGVLERVYDERLRLNPGAERLVEGLHRRGIRIALVSGGFTFFTSRLAGRLGLDYSLANTLEIDDEGRLTGHVLGDIIDAAGKAAFLSRICAELDIPESAAIAVGDGANDLPMMGRAGLSVAYHAKPAVQERASCALNHRGLDGILDLLCSEGEAAGP